MSKRSVDKHGYLSESEKDELRSRVNRRISQCCNYMALIIMVVVIAQFVVGHADTFFSQFGSMVAIALLAIAAINNPAHKR